MKQHNKLGAVAVPGDRMKIKALIHRKRTLTPLASMDEHNAGMKRDIPFLGGIAEAPPDKLPSRNHGKKADARSRHNAITLQYRWHAM